MLNSICTNNQDKKENFMPERVRNQSDIETKPQILKFEEGRLLCSELKDFRLKNFGDFVIVEGGRRNAS